MENIKTFQTRIYITPEIERQFNMGFGTRRWVWNWAVNQYFVLGNKISGFALDMLLNKYIRENPEEYKWIKSINTMVKTNAIQDFGVSLRKYLSQFSDCTKEGAKPQLNKHKGKPKFKKKKDASQSFSLSNKGSTFKIKGRYTFNFNWTREFGRINVRTRESLDFLKRHSIKKMNIFKRAGKFYMSICYENSNNKLKQKGTGTVGLDLGIKHLYTSFDGVNFDISNGVDMCYINAKIARLNKKLSRQQTNSHNFKKTLLQLQKWYRKGVDVKKDQYYKIVNHLCRSYDTIIVDDFSFDKCLKGLHKYTNQNRHHIAHKMQDISPYMFKTILEKKAKEYNVEVKFIPKGTLTTQTCSHCGHQLQKRLNIQDRTFTCEVCGFTLDRDQNSAINVYKYI